MTKSFYRLSTRNASSMPRATIAENISTVTNEDGSVTISWVKDTYYQSSQRILQRKSTGITNDFYWEDISGELGWYDDTFTIPAENVQYGETISYRVCWMDDVARIFVPSTIVTHKKLYPSPTGDTAINFVVSTDKNNVYWENFDVSLVYGIRISNGDTDATITTLLINNYQLESMPFSFVNASSFTMKLYDLNSELFNQIPITGFTTPSVEYVDRLGLNTVTTSSSVITAKWRVKNRNFNVIRLYIDNIFTRDINNSGNRYNNFMGLQPNTTYEIKLQVLDNDENVMQELIENLTTLSE